MTTLKVDDDNLLVRTVRSTPGQRRALVIDGGGSLRVSPVGGRLGRLAEDHGWSGVVVWGVVRDTSASVSASRSWPRVKRRKRAVHATLGSTTQRRGSGMKPRLASVCVMTSRRIP